MCYYLAFNYLCGESGMRCPFVYLKNKWAIACPKYREWLGSLGLGSYCEPPVPNSARSRLKTLYLARTRFETHRDL